MGLGKTIQVMGLISRVYENSKNIKPILIICPLSVMDNWKTEILKYTNFVFEEFLGGGQESFFLNPSNILLCSYDTLRNEIENLKEIEFSLTIFDEGQKLKNYKSLTANSAKKINAISKFVLTGTQ